MLAVGIFQTITIALSTVCEYKLPYFIFDSDDYASVVAVSGIISGIVNMGFSALISGLINYFDYNPCVTIINVDYVKYNFHIKNKGKIFDMAFREVDSHFLIY